MVSVGPMSGVTGTEMLSPDPTIKEIPDLVKGKDTESLEL